MTPLGWIYTDILTEEERIAYVEGFRKPLEQKTSDMIKNLTAAVIEVMKLT